MNISWGGIKSTSLMDIFGNIDNTVIGNFNLLAIILGPLVIFGATKRP
jgi:hypothetical protein